jgi:predicted ATPase
MKLQIKLGAMPIYLRTLGGLWLEGSAFRRPKPLLLLAYLALEGPKPRRYLAELFFMEAADQMNSLSRALSYLRQEVPGVIEADNKKVWGTVSCDASELLSFTDNKQFEKCLGLYQGAFAADYELGLSEELEEWLYGTREILAAKARNAFLNLGESEAAKSNFSQAAQLAEKAYKLKEAKELEPDDFRRLYNLLYAGNSPLAADIRKEAKSFEIPLELSREEAKAHLSEVSETTLETANNLPLPKSSFVGRDQELIAIATQLAEPDCRLLTLHGTGGVGKSRLALQAAYDQLKAGTWEGIYFVALDALSSIDSIPSVIAEVTGLNLAGEDNAQRQLEHWLGARNILLILDNYEHLITGAMLTSHLLETCPNLRLIVTSRERLNVLEEWVLPLKGLTIPTQLSQNPKDIGQLSAVQLFTERAKQTKLDFTLQPEDNAHVLRLCLAVEGLPLGLELAASWVKLMPLAEITENIQQLSAVPTTLQTVAEQQRSLQSAFEHSWKLLTMQQQEALKKLSVFVGGFQREAAAEVAGVTLPQLATLVDKSLVRLSDTYRFDFHALLHQFAREKLSKDEAVKREVEAAHLTYYLTKSQEYAKNFNNEKAKETMTFLAKENANLTAAWQRSHDADVLMDFIKVLAVYHRRRGIWEEQQGLLEYTLAVTEQQEKTEHLPKLYNLLAEVQQTKGNLHEAKKLLERSLSYQTENVTATKAESLNELGGIHYNGRDFDKALPYFEEALQIYRDLDDVYGQGEELNNIGICYYEQADYQKAIQIWKQAITLHRRVKNLDQQALLLNNLGGAYRQLGELEEALVHFEKARDLQRELGNQAILILLLSNIAAISFLRGEFHQSLNMYSEIFAWQETNHDSLGQAITLNSKAMIFERFGDLEEAQRYLERALTLQESLDDRLNRAITLYNLSNVLLQLNKVERAKIMAKASLKLAEETDNAFAKANAFYFMGDVLFAQANLAAAEKNYHEAAALHHSLSNKSGLVMSYSGLAKLYYFKSDYRAAEKWARESLQLAIPMNLRPDIRNAKAILAKLYKELRQEERAIQLAKEVIHLDEFLHHPKLEEDKALFKEVVSA